MLRRHAQKLAGSYTACGACHLSLPALSSRLGSMSCYCLAVGQGFVPKAGTRQFEVGRPVEAGVGLSHLGFLLQDRWQTCPSYRCFGLGTSMLTKLEQALSIRRADVRPPRSVILSSVARSTSSCGGTRWKCRLPAQ